MHTLCPRALVSAIHHRYLFCYFPLLSLSFGVGRAGYVGKTGKPHVQWRYPTHLEEEGVAQRVAEAEDEVFLGVLRHSLHDAVLHPDGVLGDAVVVYPRPAISLIEKECATCGNRMGSE